MLDVTLQAMLAHVTATPMEAQPPGFAPRFNASIELMLCAAPRHIMPRLSSSHDALHGQAPRMAS